MNNCRKCAKAPFCKEYGKENCTEYINIISVELDKIDKEAEEIDIQNIKKFDEIRDCSAWTNDNLSKNQREIVFKINEIIKAVKQIDYKLNNR